MNMIKRIQKSFFRTSFKFRFSTTQETISRNDLILNYKLDVANDRLQYNESQYNNIRLLQKLKIVIETKKDTFSPSSSKDTLKKRIKGLYFYGEVGTGKTMIMDQFFARINFEKKKRIHFHDFMNSLHKSLHEIKTKMGTKSNIASILKGKVEPLAGSNDPSEEDNQDPLYLLARKVYSEAQLLCLDELQLNDIADAHLLTRLLKHLWGMGTVLVATSNRHPNELYKGGLNRYYFEPFFQQLQNECILAPVESQFDYRKQSVALEDSFFVPNNDQNLSRLWELFLENLKRQDSNLIENVAIQITPTRSIGIPFADRSLKIVWIPYEALCGENSYRGSLDYFTLSQNIHTIYIPDIPLLSVKRHNEARRFITLIDELYNQNVRLIWTSAAHPLELFHILPKGAENEEESDGTQRKGNTNDSEELKNLGTDHVWTSDDLMSACIEPDSVVVDPTLKDAVEPKYSRNSSQNFIKINHTRDEELNVLESELASIQELKFAFQRAASRMIEMAGPTYLERWEKIYFPKKSSTGK